MVHVQSVRATVPRRGGVRARLRVLEGGVGLPETDESRQLAFSQLGNGLYEEWTLRGRVIREGGDVVYAAAPWHQ